MTNLASDRRRDFRSLVAALDIRFGTSHCTEISKVKFKNRVRQCDEELPALAKDIERLARLAYAGVSPNLIDTLAQDQFIDSLPDDDMRPRLRQERPLTLQRALELALELESFRLANRQQRTRVSWGTKLQNEVKPQDVTTTTLNIAKKMEAASDQIVRSMEKLEALMRGHRKPNLKSPRRKDTHDTKVGSVGRKVIFATIAQDVAHHLSKVTGQRTKPKEKSCIRKAKKLVPKNGVEMPWEMPSSCFYGAKSS